MAAPLANIGIPTDPAANERRLRHIGRISYLAFKVNLAVWYPFGRLAQI